LPVPSVVNAAYGMQNLKFGRNYILPKPLDPRLLTTVSPAVARGAMESGVAARPITDWDDYNAKLRSLKGFDSRLIRSLTDAARRDPKRVVFSEGNTDSMIRAAVVARREGVAQPILLGNDEMIQKRANKLGLSLEGIEIVNPRHDCEMERREQFAEKLAQKRQRGGMTLDEARDKMFDRNYFGMMMVDAGQADAVIVGTYASSAQAANIAKEVIGIRPSYDHFATMHILNTKRGIFFLADTMINQSTDEAALLDIARLTRNSVEYFNHEPVIAMVSHSNFGSSTTPECRKAHDVVDTMQERYPDLAIDGEMQVNYALNRELRDKTFPFTRLKGKDVNTLVFPNLSAASAAYRLILEMGVGEAIGPIQMGLNKPVHFINVDTPVRDIVNVVTVAALDAEIGGRVARGEVTKEDK
ncbi:MAG: NADP-dependent malic enzyme, partial [Muribaculaceae bacterium]|nr:NADP-dependent malic enzyme [Muribaculaceae bacterium]